MKQNESDKALRRLFNRRLETVVKNAIGDNMARTAKRAVDFEDWFVAMIKGERRRWYQEGLEDGRRGAVCHP